MLLSDIFEYLSYGELAQVSLGGGGTHELGIQAEDYPKLVRNVNMGLIELHKRFPIKQNEIVIKLYSHITIYYLRKAFAESNTASTEPYKYLMDGTLLEPFNDDVILIRGVFDEAGDEFPINDVNETTSLFTPQQDALQVPWPDNENSLSVIYRAGPQKINHIGLSRPELVQVDLPDQFLEPLCAYVAFRIFSSLNLGEGNAEANSHYANFERSCALIKKEGLYVADSFLNAKFGENRWP